MSGSGPFSLSRRGRSGTRWPPDVFPLYPVQALSVRTLRFKNFSEAFAFLTRVAMHAEKVDHHPEFTNVWNRVDFRLTTHDTGGVTERDLKLAEAINRLV